MKLNVFVIGSFFEIGINGGFFIKNFVLLIEYVIVLKFNFKIKMKVRRFVELLIIC